MRQRLTSIGVLAVAAAAALAIAAVPAAPTAGRVEVVPPRDTRVACLPVVEGQLLAQGLGPVTARQDGADVGSPGTTITAAVTSLTTLRGLAPAGGVLSDQGQWSPCAEPATSGIVSWPVASRAELRLANPDASEAVVDLRLYGPDGVIEAAGAGGIALAPGETRQVAVSVLAGRADTPVAVEWTASRGRAVAVGVTAGSLRHLSGSAAVAATTILPGQGEGGVPRVVLTNPGDERATATITLLSTGGRRVPESGQDLSVPARSTIVADLDGGTSGAAGAFEVESDEPLAATLFTGRGEQVGASVGAPAHESLTGLVPHGSALQLTNPGETDAVANITIGQSTQRVEIQSGVTHVVAVPGDAPTVVAVQSDVALVGAAVTTEGRGIVPLRSATAPTAESIPAERVPTLR